MKTVRPHHQILSLVVTAGFFEDVTFDFADGLICVLGPSGTGKTTLLELIRFCLGQDPEDEAQAKRFKSYMRANLGAGGVVRLRVRTKDGAEYRIERAWNESPIVFDAKGKAVPDALQSDLLFRADVYSQHEIVAISTEPDRQLALLDKFVDPAVLRTIAVDIDKVGRLLAVSAARIVSLDREIKDFSERASVLPVLAEKLKAFESTGDKSAARLDEAHRLKVLRETERKTLGFVVEESRAARQGIDATISGLTRNLKNRIGEDIARGPNADLFEPVEKSMRAVVAALERAESEIGAQLDAAERVAEEQTRPLAERHAVQDREYHEQLERSKEERSRAAARTDAQAQFDEARSFQKNLDARNVDRLELWRERQKLLNHLSELREERFRARAAAARELSETLANVNVKIEVVQDGGREPYERALTEALRGSTVRQKATAEKLALLAPRQFVACVEKPDGAAALASLGKIDESTAQGVIDHLRSTEKLYALEAFEIDDGACIKLQEKDCKELSTGQRCTAILPILLRESESPLLVDQPEDNLDAEFVSGPVIDSLLAMRGRRQLLFATHNANIPVLGDPGRVFILSATATKGNPPKSGTVDELKREIETRVEGGKNAFKRRKERYGY